MTLAVEFIDVGKTYRDFRGPFTALHGLTLAIPQGSITALLGPNGAGKSTAMRMLGSLSLPTTGEVRLFGRDIRAVPSKERAAVGYVGQNLSVDSFASVRENLRFQAAVQRINGRERNARVSATLAEFGLEGVADTPVRKLSGGMRRRVDLAMGMIHQPSLLLLDEPTVNLDPDSRQQLWQCISRAHRQRGMTVVFATHYLDEADEYAQQVVFINKGKVIADGTPQELTRRLSGETLIMEFFAEEDAASAATVIERLGGVTRTLVTGSKLLSTLPDASAAVPLAMSSLNTAQLQARSVSINKPSLNDVYLVLTGESFSDADTLGKEARLAKERAPWQ